MFGVLDHIIHDLLGGLNILFIRTDLIRHTKKTYVDHSRDISHEPHPALHRLLGMFLEFYIVRDLSLGSEFLTARSAWSSMYTSRVDELTFPPLDLSMI
jgi:hypothetical protein